MLLNPNTIKKKKKKKKKTRNSVGKCPKISNILFYIFLAYIFLFMQFLLKILGGMANSVDPDQTSPSGAV